MAWIEQTILPYLLLGLAALVLGLTGIAMRIRSRTCEDRFIGSTYEVQLILGTFMAVIFLPIGVAVLVMTYLR